jgi:hypothetical protein
MTYIKGNIVSVGAPSSPVLILSAVLPPPRRLGALFPPVFLGIINKYLILTPSVRNQKIICYYKPNGLAETEINSSLCKEPECRLCDDYAYRTFFLYLIAAFLFRLYQTVIMSLSSASHFNTSRIKQNVVD